MILFAKPRVRVNDGESTREQLMKRFGWDESEYDAARAMGLPIAGRRIFDNPGALSARDVIVFSNRDVNEWIERVVRIAATLK